MNIQPSVSKSVTSPEPTKKMANETCSKGETTEGIVHCYMYNLQDLSCINAVQRDFH